MKFLSSSDYARNDGCSLPALLEHARSLAARHIRAVTFLRLLSDAHYLQTCDDSVSVTAHVVTLINSLVQPSVAVAGQSTAEAEEAKKIFCAAHLLSSPSQHYAEAVRCAVSGSTHQEVAAALEALAAANVADEPTKQLLYHHLELTEPHLRQTLARLDALVPGLPACFTRAVFDPASRSNLLGPILDRYAELMLLYALVRLFATPPTLAPCAHAERLREQGADPGSLRHQLEIAGKLLFGANSWWDRFIAGILECNHEVLQRAYAYFALRHEGSKTAAVG